MNVEKAKRVAMGIIAFETGKSAQEMFRTRAVYNRMAAHLALRKQARTLAKHFLREVQELEQLRRVVVLQAEEERLRREIEFLSVVRKGLA